MIGAGASALDMAGLMHDAGAEVQLVGRKPEVKFHGDPTGRERSLWQRLTRPSSRLGARVKVAIFCGISAGIPLFAGAVCAFEAVQRALGPTGGYFIKNKVVGKVPMHLGYSPEGAQVRGGKVHLSLRSVDGTVKELVADHIVAGTGYRVNIDNPQVPERGHSFRGTTGQRISSALVEL